MEYVEMCTTGLKVIYQNAHSMLNFKTLNQTHINDFSRATEKFYFILYTDATSVFFRDMSMIN